jgi:hypothetical protein
MGGRQGACAYVHQYKHGTVFHILPFYRYAGYRHQWVGEDANTIYCDHDYRSTAYSGGFIFD